MEQSESEMPANSRASQPQPGSGTRPTTVAVSPQERWWMRPAVACGAFLVVSAVTLVTGFISKPIGENLLANGLTTVVLLCATWAITQYFYHRRRNLIFKFFGIKPENPTVTIYLSNLLVTQTTALEHIEKGYMGPAISKIEYEAALSLQTAIAAQPMALLSGKLYRTLGRFGFKLSRPSIDVKTSPRNADDAKKPDFGWQDLQISMKQYLLPGTIIVLGSDIYNCVAKWYFDVHLGRCKKANPEDFGYCRFDKQEDGQRVLLRVMRGTERPASYHREVPLTDGAYRFGIEPACVMRFRDDGRTIFLCGGIAEWSTANSVKYLLENWAELHERYHEQDFGVVLKFGLPSSFDERFENLERHLLEDRFVL
jgi:hypothetical protein